MPSADAEHDSDPAEPTTVERDPDYRFTLANERTFLAWLRTALALDAGGVAVVSLVPDFGPPGARQVIGAVLAALGVAVTVAAIRRWQRVQRAMRRDEDLPRTRMPLLLGLALGVVGGVLVVLLALPGSG